MRAALMSIGASALTFTELLGGMMVLLWQIIRALTPPRFDARETWRSLYKIGVKSCAIVILTALFTGILMVIQSGHFVRKTGATGLLGWGAGYAVLAEIGPVLIGLMFSGKVGANNTAELGTMTVTEQVNALRALAINPIRYLVVPRFISMVIMLVVLTCIGDLFALIGGAVTSQFLLGVDWRIFYYGVVDAHLLQDFLTGLLKAACFGATIAVTSCYFGLRGTGGAPGVGKAVNMCVVTNAIGIFAIDFLLTYITSL